MYNNFCITFRSLVDERKIKLNTIKLKCGLSMCTVKSMYDCLGSHTVMALRELQKVFGDADMQLLVDAYCTDVLLNDDRDKYVDVVKIIDCIAVKLFMCKSTLWHNVFSNKYNKLDLCVGRAATRRLKDMFNLDVDLYRECTLSDDEIKSVADDCVKYYNEVYNAPTVPVCTV